MKTIIFTLSCLLILLKAESQNKSEKWNVGVHGGMTQYSGDLGQGWYSTKQAIYGFGGVSVSRYLNKRFDAWVLLTRGQLGFQAQRDFSTNLDYNFRINLTTANVLLRYNLTSRESVFAPFLFFRGTVMKQETMETVIYSNRKKYVDFAVPTGGIGVHFRLGPFVSLQILEMFMYTLADDIDHRVSGANDMYLFHTVGLTFNIKKKEKMRNQNWKRVNVEE